MVRTIYEKAAGFTFPAVYEGSNVLLTILPAEDRFAVWADEQLMGHIKIGYERHTWFVNASKFVDRNLVNEIGQRILNEYY
ncbi:MAG TPA: hypothetical protein VFE53_23670 [Mucilaginibacter sp.]|jgi:hypothetical protein|nr:hypothetical protein [Mucilaginibacter sp.]